jgi:hypothetical protein
MNSCTCGAPLPAGYDATWHARYAFHWTFLRGRHA